MGRRQGLGLGSTLAFLGIVATLTFAVAGASMQNLVLSQRMEEGRQALELAESVVSLGIERVMADRTFAGTLEVARQDGVARLTFAPDEAARRGLPLSTNNLDGESASAGHEGRSVPAESVHLVGVAQWRGTRRQVEAIVHVPRFPYVLAMSGRIESTGGLLVAGVPLGAGVGPLDRSALLPGHVASNGSGENALVLGADTEITGDVRAAGEVKTDPNGGTRIRGQVRSYADPVRIPDLDVTAYDPVAQGKAGVQTLASSYLDAPILQGFAKRTGDLVITDGARLEGAVLYVDGNLRIEGRLEGTGALFVTGTTTLIGGTGLSSDNLVALLSRGDLTLRGDGRDASRFQGLVYTEGNLQADRLSVFGTLIGNGAAGSHALLSDVNLVHVPENTSFDLYRGEGAETLWFQPSGDVDPYGAADPDHVPVTVRKRVDGTYEVIDAATRTTLGAGLTEDGAVEAIHQHLDRNPRTRAFNGWGLEREGKVRTRMQAIKPPRKAGTPGTPVLSVDPSQLLQLPDRARVALWRRR